MKEIKPIDQKHKPTKSSVDKLKQKSTKEMIELNKLGQCKH